MAKGMTPDVSKDDNTEIKYISPCSDAISGIDGETATYCLKGQITSIANTTWGNWYLQDSTGHIYIYGTLDATGNEKNFTSLGLEVGDTVIIEGPRGSYNSTPQLVNVTVLNSRHNSPAASFRP